MEAFERLGHEIFDMFVIGGGINGCAVALDAAQRGLKVALVEREDFAAGTSSRSSRLIHGGLRYLEHGHLHLVFESSSERRILGSIAPHLIRPLAFTWPVYRGARVPRWKLLAGMLLYDTLSLFRNFSRHQRLGVDDLRALEPRLRTDGLTGGARYYDAATNDTRLTLANAIAAAEAHAVMLNHCEVVEVSEAAGEARISVRDTITGAVHHCSSRTVVNAAGPWADAVALMTSGDTLPSIRGTKGAHIAVPRERVGNRDAVTVLSPDDGRVMFILPAGTLAIVGTTDTPTTVLPDEVRADEGDVAYLLSAVNHHFPEARLERSDVVSAWAGIRPLAAVKYTGSATGASREHSLTWNDGRTLTISGGKLTTYRVVAAQTVDMVEARLGRSPVKSATASTPLPGGDMASLERELAIALDELEDATTATHLIMQYGTRWRRIAEIMKQDPALAQCIMAGLPYVLAEITYAAREEMALSIADVFVRRTHLAFDAADHGARAASAAASILARELGWPDAERERQLHQYSMDASRIFMVEPAGPALSAAT